MNVWRPVELALTLRREGRMARVSGRQPAIRHRRPFQPKWAPAPLMKSSERTRPQFGWPRTTDSLCPTCVRETRARILCGEQSIESLVNEHVGEIKAHIVERDGKVVIEKTCPHARHVRRHAGDQPGVPPSGSRTSFPGATSTPSPTACTITARRRSSTAAARS